MSFNWNLILALKIILSLTTGSMLSMWFAELITNENLGNGSSMIIFINILGSLPSTINEFGKSFNSAESLNKILLLGAGVSSYILVVCLIILVQDSYKKVNIVSARQLNFNYVEQSIDNFGLKNVQYIRNIPLNN